MFKKIGKVQSSKWDISGTILNYAELQNVCKLVLVRESEKKLKIENGLKWVNFKMGYLRNHFELCGTPKCV